MAVSFRIQLIVKWLSPVKQALKKKQTKNKQDTNKGSQYSSYFIILRELTINEVSLEKQSKIELVKII